MCVGGGGGVIAYLMYRVFICIDMCRKMVQRIYFEELNINIINNI